MVKPKSRTKSKSSLEPIEVVLIVGTRNEGNQWQLLAENLPAILSVEAAVV